MSNENKKKTVQEEQLEIEKAIEEAIARSNAVFIEPAFLRNRMKTPDRTR